MMVCCEKKGHYVRDPSGRVDDRERSASMANTEKAAHPLFEVWPSIAVGELASRQAQYLKYCKAGQDEYLDEWQELIDNWCMRRHKSVEAAWAMLQELQGGKDGADVVAVWGRWMSGVIQRLAEDANDQIAIICRASRFCTEANGLFMPSVPDLRRPRGRDGNGGTRQQAA
jgi:hypothetical protein